nr:MBL fold metallo-hydrolase [uncultured Romboutsia sp.]
MNLTNISGNTFFVRGGTNTGLYLFEDNSALIIDPGLSGARPNKIIKILSEKNIKLKYIINTHEHNDHFGACSQFKEYYKDVEILSSQEAKLYIENLELFSRYIMGGKSNIFMDDKLKHRAPKAIDIDTVINEGILNINNKQFEIFNLKGHTSGSIGVLTDDKVLFVGDVLVGEEMLSKYDFLFLFDIKEQIKSLEIIEKIDFKYLVIAHSKKFISKDESYKIIDKHKKAIDKYVNQVRLYLKSPTTIENILKQIIVNNNLSHNYKEYHFFKSSLISLISYLIDLGEVDYILSDGELLYYTKNKKIMLK